MTPIALILVIASTFAHAFWNYLGKRRSPSAAFFLTASLAVTVFLSPLLVIYHRAIAHIPAPVWALLVATGACQAIYYAGLAGAYRFGDLSVAYPLARALPALLVTLASVVLGLGKPITAVGYAGILIVVAGCLLIPQPGFRGLRISHYWNLCCALALLAACGTTGYTIIDSEALRILRATPALNMTHLEIAVLFMLFETAMTAAWLGVYLLFSASERAAFREVRRNGWRYAAVTGLIITATYGLVLAAMAYVTNVSYLAAFRELSIPLGAMLGVTLQKEPAPAPKITGIGVVLVGLLLVGLA